MRIGVVTTWYPRGAAYVSLQYEQALQPEHDVFIYARGGEKPPLSDKEWHGPNVHWGREPVFDAGPASIELDDFRQWIEKNKLDWVLFNEQWWLEPLLVCAKAGVRTAAYVVEYKTHQIPLHNAYDLMLANTRQHYETFKDIHPGIRYVPWGTDIEYFRPETLEPVSPGCVTFVNSAGLNAPRKGTDLVLAAFSALWQEGLHNIRLVIHSQAPIRTTLGEQSFLDLEAAGALKYRGPDAPDSARRSPLAERRGLYTEGDIYLYPSRFDGLGLSVPEATACGLPSITTNHPPMNEFVGEGNGATVDITSVYTTVRAHHSFAEPSLESLTARMRDFALRFTPEMKRQARAYAEEHFDWRKNARILPELFRPGAVYQTEAAKAIAFQQIREVEEKNRTTLRARVGYRFPELIRAFRHTYRTLARR